VARAKGARWTSGRRTKHPDSSLRPPDGPTRHEENPAQPELLSSFSLCGIVKSWMDEDVIEATVRHAISQGADAVYVVDNGSTDDTVAIAEAAGATVAEVYQTEVFDGRMAQALMNAVVARESLRHESGHVWWLYLDSDEFPEGPHGLSIRDHLATLDRRFRVVGSKYLNHMPDAKPEYLPGYHPIDFQPLYYEFEPVRQPPCPLGHWKHCLQRIDRSGHFVMSNPGSHTASCSEVLIEPSQGILTHHFQYRDEHLTRAKLELTCGRGAQRTAPGASGRDSGFVRRLRSLDAVYAGRWDEVDTVPNRDPAAVRHPKRWSDPGSVRRWYPVAEVERARSQWTDTGADPAKAR
jgi:glycosyltransferase involved in cell wall biosynthesis